MRIGIDAKWYFNGHPSGKVVVENLVNHILNLDKSVEFYIYLDKRDKKRNFPVKSSNIHLVYVPNYINAFTNFFILPFYTKKNNLDVCLYQNYAPIWGSKKRINYVHDALFLDYPQYFSFFERIYFSPIKYLSKWSSHVITISESEKSRMVKHRFGDEKKISVVHHGLGLVNVKQELSDIEINIKTKYNLPKKFILYLGRLNIRKNITVIINAMPLIDKDLSLVIIGRKDHKMFDLDKLISELNLSKRVLKMGYLPKEEIACFYKEASVFCFPSFAEGFGLPPIEAMHYETPVVVSNTTSLPEICSDSALYVDPKDYKDLANKINTIVNNNEIRNTLIEKGRKRALEFSWEKAAKEVLNIMKSI